MAAVVGFVESHGVARWVIADRICDGSSPRDFHQPSRIADILHRPIPSLKSDDNDIFYLLWMVYLLMGYGSLWSNHVMNAANYIHVHFPSRILGKHAKIVALDSKAMFIGTSRYSITIVHST